MLLNNWNPATGLVRDKSRDASGEMDAVQATGSLAAATAVAYQLDIVSRKSAIRIVKKISKALLDNLPRYEGLWPHWIKGPSMEILRSEEWSSVDSAIAALGLMGSQIVFGLDTSDTKAMLKAVNWENLRKPKGISHGYSYDKKLLPYLWDTFGGESWLIELAYVMGSDNRPSRLAFPLPPTETGRGSLMNWPGCLYHLHRAPITGGSIGRSGGKTLWLIKSTTTRTDPLRHVLPILVCLVFRRQKCPRRGQLIKSKSTNPLVSVADTGGQMMGLICLVRPSLPHTIQR